MESHRLVLAGLSALSALVITTPAEAATLQYWWFDAEANQLRILLPTRECSPGLKCCSTPPALWVEICPILAWAAAAGSRTWAAL